MKVPDMPVCFLFVTEWILWNLHPVLHQLSQVSTVYSTVASDAVCDVEFRRYIELSVVSQFSGGADGVHEEQNFSQVLQRSTGCAEAFAPSGLLPAQAGSENSEISPVVTGTDRTEWSHYCIVLFLTIILWMLCSSNTVMNPCLTWLSPYLGETFNYFYIFPSSLLLFFFEGNR